MDAKGRTSLPSKFRELIAAGGATNVIVTQGPDHTLWCYAPAEWAKLEEQLARRSPFDPKVRAFVNGFVSPAQECPVDGMGRILIPSLLRQHAGLEGEVVWAGAIGHIELWSVDAWKRRSEETLAVLGSDPFGSEGP